MSSSFRLLSLIVPQNAKMSALTERKGFSTIDKKSFEEEQHAKTN
ncbi:hypothetical protein BSSC8_03580 [Bacillus subtilis subsp. subtilis str. SC-8]|nr:hypothetical protein ABU16_0707 [Bacillus subtilis]EHA32101.1 hypothetical protein BSSC8_03580 [Bacillus subtilis subsp. subtilis str. SC-8]